MIECASNEHADVQDDVYKLNSCGLGLAIATMMHGRSSYTVVTCRDFHWVKTPWLLVYTNGWHCSRR